ncbi:hypothetical protein BH11ACT3_BH11ACT3_08270 [soil metagenome]
MIPASEAALVPLVSDDDVLERVTVLVGHGIRRQAWLMFLDDENRQLPLLMPTDLPRKPRRDDAHRFAEFLSDLVEVVDAAAVVLTLERPASEELTEADLAWLRMMRSGCRIAGVRLRGPLLAHRSGVRWIAADDLGIDE